MVHAPCCLLLSFFNYRETSVMETFNTHPCVICISSCPLPQMYCCDWILCLRLKALSEHEEFLFLVYFVAALFHEKKQKARVSDTQWKAAGGAVAVGSRNTLKCLLLLLRLDRSEPGLDMPPLLTCRRRDAS